MNSSGVVHGIIRWPICAEEESRTCWYRITIFKCYFNDRSGKEMRNEVDATDDNTLSIESQGKH